MIGFKFYKGQFEDSDYTDVARWCNETQQARIEDMGDYYEVVPIPEPTADELLDRKKADRAVAVKNITVEVDGMVFDGDEDAQERMSRAVVMFSANNLPSNTMTKWVLADGTVADVTVYQLSQALLLAGQKQTELWIKPYD